MLSCVRFDLPKSASEIWTTNSGPSLIMFKSPSVTTDANSMILSLHQVTSHSFISYWITVRTSNPSPWNQARSFRSRPRRVDSSWTFSEILSKFSEKKMKFYKTFWFSCGVNLPRPEWYKYIYNMVVVMFEQEWGSSAFCGLRNNFNINSKC